ncbi:cytochrome c biogenesis protein CcdA [Rhodobacter capsulatus]|uniref:cytochrome c biogenesis CcdA family protein n=1 Tax=Rhodobacter capsulatus TaxID=1061 RepID=UPI0006DC237A|nr:cytochrome c biogenesis protein CcdA [Rhodobacter capsulatus]KQB12242.1 cytochrome C biogenesis protein [Rhodobacter capsulatus]KQB12616.1 cytochrome C biogenesis protein [Rhodobacter capsulatus]PZX23304.1 cytochrome c-type biogenesis protein [Rhodobacter capsulatus]QNR61683.1 cytochrome c biogenesis protein CcdA [Rhodobacter capsulatus]
MTPTDLIFDAGFLTAAATAFAAGFLSFLSPCVLPIVPPYLAYMGGVTVSDMGTGRPSARGRVLLAALFFVLGLSTVFLMMGLGASALGQALGAWKDTLARVSGLVVMIFGAHFIGVYRIGFLDREMRFDTGDQGGSALGAYLLGLAFAFGWTPCLGPVLGTIASMAMVEGTIGRGMALLSAYAAGLGLPFLIVAAFFPSLGGALAFMRRNMGRIEKISGLLLWTIGLMMLTGQLSDLSFWLLDTFPALAELG